MKKLILVVILIFSSLSFVDAKELPKERIEKFDVSINLESNSKINVVETIHYNFGDQERHGIYREIPYSYQNNGEKFDLKISDIFVTDEDGISHQHKVQRKNGKIHIKIGNPDTIVNNQETYKISYSVRKAVKFFDTHDEIYWNVTGNNWLIPIIATSAQIRLPMNSTPQEVECFVGYIGSIEKCKFNGSEFSSRSLLEGEGMTIVVGFPKEVLSSNQLRKKVGWFIQDNPIIFLPLVVLFIFSFIWYFLGRDPQMNSIVPTWEIPDYLTPFACGILIDEKLQQRDLSSLFVDLAIRGYISIKKIDENEYQFVQEKSRRGDNSLEHFERVFLDELFRSDKSLLESNDASDSQNSKKKTVKLSDLGKQFRDATKIITKMGYASLVDRFYYKKTPRFASMPLIPLAGTATMVYMIFLVISEGGNLIHLLCVITSQIIAYMFMRNMSRKTKYGVQAKAKILGLKMYIEATEERRIEMCSDPSLLPPHNIDTFHKYLPYAMVLGVEKFWTQEFSDIYVEGNTYMNQDTQLFSSSGISTMISNFANASGVTIVSQATTGGSGFSGGSSGGGTGGGGGGGSW